MNSMISSRAEEFPPGWAEPQFTGCSLERTLVSQDSKGLFGLQLRSLQDVWSRGITECQDYAVIRLKELQICILRVLRICKMYIKGKKKIILASIQCLKKKQSHNSEIHAALMEMSAYGLNSAVASDHMVEQSRRPRLLVIITPV